MTKQDRIIVLGAGPAGIAAGLALGRRGLVLDPCPEVGGLCRTLELDGAVFDYGGHSFHTPHPEIRRLVFNALEMFEQPRQARCYYDGTMLPYPFQTHFDKIGRSQIVLECSEGLRTAPGGQGAQDFEDYLCRRFGPGIARHFLLPYNRKLWGRDLRRLVPDWAQERVAAPQGEREGFADKGGKRTPLQSNTTVAYPARGGFGEIFAALARGLADLRLGTRVTRLLPRQRLLVTDRGESFRWERLISTLPVDTLIKIILDVPPALADACGRLQALPLALVFVVIGHPVDTAVQRVYSAGPEIPAHKIVINHNSSPFLRGRPRHGILAEVSGWQGNADTAGELVKQVIQGLLALKLVKSFAEVTATRVIRVARGYPMPTHERPAIMERLKSWLQEQEIYTLGRFGEWAYINSDEALHRGFQLGQKLAA
jgi:protoporphyrinogen oxidase